MERSFTLRALLMGALVGVLAKISNTYHGLRAGVANQMSTLSSLLGFAGFKAYSRWTSYPLSVRGSVSLISVTTATGAMPVTAGIIGIIHALEYLIAPREAGSLTLNYYDLILWSIGLCVPIWPNLRFFAEAILCSKRRLTLTWCKRHCAVGQIIASVAAQ